MTPDDFLVAVRETNRTALSRLGSSKALYAETGGALDANTVLDAAATAERAAHDTFAGWADDEPNVRASDAFETTAAEEAKHYELVTDVLGREHERDELPALHAYLRGLDDTVERVGGFVGRTLASEQSKSQLVGFFVGDADPKTASLFRDLGADLDEQLARGVELLEAVCEGEDDWDRAKEAADDAIQAAYGEYTETLEGMGINPKPVC